MKTTLAVCLLALSGLALADGVPLVAAGPAVSAPTGLINAPGFVKMHPATINKSAFGANIVTVSIEGVEHRFVGAMVLPEFPAAKPFPGDKASHPDLLFWTGKEGPDIMTLSKDLKTGAVAGMFSIRGRKFDIVNFNGVPALVEMKEVSRRTAPANGGRP